MVGVGAGVAGALGGTIAHYFGFKTLFSGVAILLLISAALPFLILKELIPKPPTKNMVGGKEKKMPKPPTTFLKVVGGKVPEAKTIDSQVAKL